MWGMAFIHLLPVNYSCYLKQSLNIYVYLCLLCIYKKSIYKTTNRMDSSVRDASNTCGSLLDQCCICWINGSLQPAIDNLLLLLYCYDSMLLQSYTAASTDVGGRYPHLPLLLHPALHGASYWTELLLNKHKKRSNSRRVQKGSKVIWW